MRKRSMTRIALWVAGLLLSIGPYVDSVSEEALLFSIDQKVVPELAKAKSVVFDFRTRSAETPGWILETLPLVSETVPVPAWRHVFHSGYAPDSGSTSGGYYSSLQIVPSRSLQGSGRTG